MSEISDVAGSRKVSKKGFIIYEITVSHSQLGLKEIIRGQFPLVLQEKAQLKAQHWDAIWEKKCRQSSLRQRPESIRQERLATADAAHLNLKTSA